jgi:cell division protease FtsH
VKNNKNNKFWKNFGLYALLLVVVIVIGSALIESQPQQLKEWRYSQLIEAVENKQVSRVNISNDNSWAEATIPDPDGIDGKKKVRVNLPRDPEFLDTIAA